jgi:predicted RNA-binding protein Jag
MTIDLRVNVNLDRYATHRYEWLDDLAETLDERINEDFATRLAAEHWAADDRPMLETLVEA